MAAESSAGKRRPVSASGAPLTENKRRGRLPDNGKTTSIEAYSQVRILLRRRIAELKGIAESGYRVIVNTNDDAQQSVHHIHVHVLGGAPMNSGDPSAK